MKFTELNLSSNIVEGLRNQGIETATEIQALALPVIKDGSDVIGLSQTGSGKTYAYGIPALEQIGTQQNGVQVLIICPTRELAMQITEDLRKLTNFAERVKIVPIFGGSNMDRQIKSLKQGAKIVIGTAGRLMDHLRRRTLKLENLKMIILDEADEMLDMGFKPDIETILKSTPQTRQTIMFSATMPPEIQKLTKQYMKAPITIKSKDHDNQHTLIKQYSISCEKSQKTEVLERIYTEFNPWISIIFCNTKRMTEDISKSLVKSGLPATYLHGDMRQNERKRVMDNFKKSGNGGILVATDVAARGIDVKNIDIVINYDFPNNEDYYTHRIGRTGRAGKTGIALTIINNRAQLKDLHDLINKTNGSIEDYTSLSTTNWTIKERTGSNQKQVATINNRPKRSPQNFNKRASTRPTSLTFQKRDTFEKNSNSNKDLKKNSENSKNNKYKTTNEFKRKTNRHEKGGFISIDYDTSHEKNSLKPKPNYKKENSKKPNFSNNRKHFQNKPKLNKQTNPYNK